MYLRLLAMAALSFISMYVLMYMMVDKFGDVYPDINQFYMAAMMTAPMVMIELLLVGTMYKNKLANTIFGLGCLVVLSFSIEFTRWQTAISDSSSLNR